MASILLYCFGERRDMFESRPAAAKADPMARRLATVRPNPAESGRRASQRANPSLQFCNAPGKRSS
jgi:hypothetical protein